MIKLVKKHQCTCVYNKINSYSRPEELKTVPKILSDKIKESVQNHIHQLFIITHTYICIYIHISIYVICFYITSNSLGMNI